MKFVDEYRNASEVQRIADVIHRVATQPWTMMEICGGQTHAIARFGLEELLPPGIELVHGPGCPVCVTPIEKIDLAVEIALLPNTIVCSYGDMLRVPGSRKDLLSAKSEGARVQAVYSPLDAVKLAEDNPDRQVVFFAVGFETTAPANALAVYTAKQRGLKNFSVLMAHVLVPPAMEALLSAPDNRVQAFLAAGHVCTIMGLSEYEVLVDRYRIPVVVTGFEPVDILLGVLGCLRQLEEGRAELENAYERVVQPEGNETARRMMYEVFAVGDREWRGMGVIPLSGLQLNEAYAEFDAESRFTLSERCEPLPTPCIAGQILRGLKKPHECPVFGTNCNPEHPLGAPMVSSEGACAAYYSYRRVSP